MNTLYETDQLVLRVCTRKEASMVLDFYKRNLEDFAKYEPISFSSVTTLKFHEEMLDYEYEAFLKSTCIRYHFFEKHNPFKVVGTMSFRNIQGGYYSSCTVGYKVDSAYRRRGYAKEALTLGLKLVENELNIHRTEALVLPDNDPSMLLLEGLGFRQEGLLREKIKLNGIWRDHYLYARVV